MEWPLPCTTIPPDSRGSALSADSVRLAGDHQHGCASWSQETATNWSGSKPQAMLVVFQVPYSSLLKHGENAHALAPGKANCEAWSHQTPQAEEEKQLNLSICWSQSSTRDHSSGNAGRY